MVPTKPTFEMSIEELGKLAIQWAQSTNDPIDPEYAAVEVKACIDIANIKLAIEDVDLRDRKMEIDRLSNEQAAQSAAALSAATQQLAGSTRLLNRATWFLVGVAAIQTIITLIALFKK